MSLLLACFIFENILSILASGSKTDPGLIRTIKPNFDAIEGLICYQCQSLSTDLQPLCDKTVFKLATTEEKYNMSLQCPYYQNKFCFTKTTIRGKVTETLRGCSKLTDQDDNEMKVGCMTTEDVVICLCDKKFCNSANTSSINWVYTFVLSFSIFMM